MRVDSFYLPESNRANPSVEAIRDAKFKHMDVAPATVADANLHKIEHEVRAGAPVLLTHDYWEKIGTWESIIDALVENDATPDRITSYADAWIQYLELLKFYNNHTYTEATTEQLNPAEYEVIETALIQEVMTMDKKEEGTIRSFLENPKSQSIAHILFNIETADQEEINHACLRVRHFEAIKAHLASLEFGDMDISGIDMIELRKVTHILNKYASLAVMIVFGANRKSVKKIQGRHYATFAPFEYSGIMPEDDRDIEYHLTLSTGESIQAQVSMVIVNLDDKKTSQITNHGKLTRVSAPIPGGGYGTIALRNLYETFGDRQNGTGSLLMTARSDEKSLYIAQQIRRGEIRIISKVRGPFGYTKMIVEDRWGNIEVHLIHPDARDSWYLAISDLFDELTAQVCATQIGNVGLENSPVAVTRQEQDLEEVPFYKFHAERFTGRLLPTLTEETTPELQVLKAYGILHSVQSRFIAFSQQTPDASPKIAKVQAEAMIAAFNTDLIQLNELYGTQILIKAMQMYTKGERYIKNVPQDDDYTRSTLRAWEPILHLNNIIDAYASIHGQIPGELLEALYSLAIHYKSSTPDPTHIDIHHLKEDQQIQVTETTYAHVATM